MIAVAIPEAEGMASITLFPYPRGPGPRRTMELWRSVKRSLPFRDDQLIQGAGPIRSRKVRNEFLAFLDSELDDDGVWLMPGA